MALQAAFFIGANHWLFLLTFLWRNSNIISRIGRSCFRFIVFNVLFFLILSYGYTGFIFDTILLVSVPVSERF